MVKDSPCGMLPLGINVLSVPGSPLMRVTTIDLSGCASVVYTAKWFLQWMKREGLATKVGFRPSSTGRGRPSTLWELPEQLVITIKRPGTSIATEE